MKAHYVIFLFKMFELKDFEIRSFQLFHSLHCCRFSAAGVQLQRDLPFPYVDKQTNSMALGPQANYID
jgi:hypothetical protein